MALHILLGQANLADSGTQAIFQTEKEEIFFMGFIIYFNI
jgi:hypothetical protein